MNYKSFLVGVGLAFAATNANASPIIVLYGDQDCFGIAAQGGAPCSTGVDYAALGGIFFEDNRQPGDPAETDFWASISRSFTINVGVPANLLSASLDLFHAGAGTVGSASISINGNVLGAFGANNNLSTLTTYDILAFVGNSNQIAITVDGNDGWTLDFAQLRLTPADVPEPASLALIGLALAGAAGARRSKRPA